jgi:hypothetical protein
MINKCKAALITAALVAGLASPAFAECLESGAQESCGGPLVQGGYSSYAQVLPAPRWHHSVRRRSGLHAFARVPYGDFGSLNPSATGGGSIGYNEHVMKDY